MSCAQDKRGLFRHSDLLASLPDRGPVARSIASNSLGRLMLCSLWLPYHSLPQKSSFTDSLVPGDGLAGTHIRFSEETVGDISVFPSDDSIIEQGSSVY